MKQLVYLTPRTIEELTQYAGTGILYFHVFDGTPAPDMIEAIGCLLPHEQFVLIDIRKSPGVQDVSFTIRLPVMVSFYCGAFLAEITKPQEIAWLMRETRRMYDMDKGLIPPGPILVP